MVAHVPRIVEKVLAQAWEDPRRFGLLVEILEAS